MIRIPSTAVKTSPTESVEPEISVDSTRVLEFLGMVAGRVNEDFEDRESWVQAREHWFRRRYCLEWRDPQTPWVGSSNIVLPLIDKKIDELKPQYVNMIASAKPPVTCYAAFPEFQKKTRNVEMWFDWLVHHGSPGFIDETILAVDDCLETGRGILKSFWRYETTQSPGILTASRLPKELRPLIVTANDEQANAAYVAAGGQGGAVVLTRRQYDQMGDVIRTVIQKSFDLDKNEARDQKALESIFQWFRGGAKGELHYEHRDVVKSVPAIRAISPLDLIVPKSATNNPEEHERITEVMYFTETQLKALAIDEKLNKSAVDRLLDTRKVGANKSSDGGKGRTNHQRRLMDIQQDSKEGIQSESREELFEIWKVCTRYSATAHAAEKKIVALIPADCPDAPLKIKAHSRPSGEWGYHTFTFELNKRRWYAPRGVPEKLDDLEAEMTAQERAKINRMSIVNSPTFKYRPGRHINPSVWKWFPGQMMPTTDPMGDVVPVQVQPLDISFDSHIQQLRVWAESYLGGSDYGISDASNLSEPRTATEIQAIQSQARQSLSMRGLMFKLCYDGIWREFFDLWHTIGPDEVYIKVTGGDEPIRLTKEDLQGKFMLQCTGTIGNSDPVLEAQKAQNRIVLLAQLKPLVEPKYEIDLGEVIRDWMEKDDIRLMKRVVRERSPEEIQKIQAEAAKQRALQQQAEIAGASPQRGGGGQQRAPAVPSLPGAGSR